MIHWADLEEIKTSPFHKGRHNTQHDDTLHNDVQHKDTQRNI